MAKEDGKYNSKDPGYNKLGKAVREDRMYAFMGVN